MTVPGASRRLVLGMCAAVAVAAVADAGAELVDHGVLPGKSELDAVDGACDLPSANLDAYAVPGPEVSGTFWSAARNRSVGYTIGYPPGHGPGDGLPLVVMLHGEGGDHAGALAGLTPARAVALRAGGRPLAPMALVTVDGGAGYWHAHAGDDPMRMLADELIPMCRRRGLGRSPGGIGVMGISMGGYGALLLAEKHPDLIAAVAAISPAVWTSYAQARAVNPQAYASAADFAANDVITHAAALTKTPVRVASGDADPFYPGVRALAGVLPRGAVTGFGQGCHDGSFFAEQEPPSLEFLAARLAAASR